MSRSTFIVIIPARMQSTRLPNKPLADIAGKPMVQRVYERAQASAATDIWVATDDQRIEAVVRGFGGKVVLTAASHPSGTDRLEEVARQQRWPDETVVVNVQGDEPLIPAAVINQVAANLIDRPTMSAATLAEPLQDVARLFDTNVVKVVRDHQGRALYFSRAPIPYARDDFRGSFDANELSLPRAHTWLRHIGIYAYRVGCLHRYVAWPRAELESMESLEQLRLLVMGESIHVELACADVPAGVDTAADLDRVRLLVGNP